VKKKVMKKKKKKEEEEEVEKRKWRPLNDAGRNPVKKTRYTHSKKQNKKQPQ